ncbi:MAG: hypothetical protein E7108_04570 [Bacteroidales bacterium]|nr:hypothetical protein [Bacteroidales bacterium]
MKSAIYIALCSLFIVSCANKEYESEAYANDRTIYNSPFSFKAPSDSSAYRSAVNYLNDYLSGREEEYIFSKIDLVVRLKNGHVVSNNDSIVPYIIVKQKQRIKEEEQKAFAGALFGMSKKEVLELNHFKDYKDYSDEGDVIYKWEVIGNKKYTVRLYFEEDKLNRVSFNNFSRQADYLDREINDEVLNLREVIEKVYGHPTNDYGIPSILNLYSGRITWAYKWEIGNKEIRIGISEFQYGALYDSYAEIVDKEQEEVKRNLKKQEKERLVEDSSSLF